MAKDRKKRDLRIKTAKYYTKTCSNCQKDYPNWFTLCPYCGTAWDESNVESEKKVKPSLNKNIKIIVKISEEDFESSIEKVQLVFSADKGKTWYKIVMENKEYYYIAEIPEVPAGTVIIYYIEVYLPREDKIIENNNNNYFYYKVGESQEDSGVISPETIFAAGKSQESHEKPLFNINKKQSKTTFQKPLLLAETQGLKICPQCNSKIKRQLTICPICGKHQP